MDTSPPEPTLSALYQELILDHYRRPRNRGTLDGATHACGACFALLTFSIEEVAQN